MKKVILIITILVLSSNLSYTDSGTSSVSWLVNSLGKECGTSTSHGVTHKGVPNSNNSSANTTGNTPCTTHSYYASSQYTVTYNNNFKACESGDIAVNTGNDIPKSGNINCRKYDDTPPRMDDIDIDNKNLDNLLANDNYQYSFTITVGDDESPITSASGTLNGTSVIISCNTPSVGSKEKTTTCIMHWDIHDVDGDRSDNGGRKYVFSLDSVCDEAGNCSSSTDSPKVFEHYVYANTLSAYFTTHDVIYNDLGSNSNIADGTTKTISINLKDTYGNAIVPASGIDRNIDFNFNNVINTMFLNQITRSDGSSVFVKTPDSSEYSNTLLNTGDNSKTITTYEAIGNSYGSGQYDFTFKVYTPTANQDNGPVSDKDAIFSIGNINIDINSNLTNPTGANPQGISVSNSIIAKFNPLYYTEITGNMKENLIIEGGTQKSQIQISKNNDTSSNNNYLLLSYGSSIELQNDADKFTMYAGSSISNSSGTIIALNPSVIKVNPMFPSSSTSTGSTDLYTRLVQRQTVKASSNIYFATHIKYNITHPNGIGQLTVNYNSDIIGRASYWGDPEDAIGNQVGVKIIGVTNTNSTNDLVTDQFINDIYVLNSNISKTTLKTQITKNGYEFARNSPGNSNTSLLQIDNPGDEIKVINNVIYFGKTSGNDANIIYQLGNNSNGYITISQNKTILIIGGDLYINSNLYYTGNGMLGIIVLKDLDGNGGNVYINPNVTNIVGNIFAEKSVISYDGIKELDGETEAITLKNQLHIYGTLFSENTIGGSREATPKCPFYVNVSTCTLETAQKYDLNYLRRYYLIKDGTTSYFKPANNGKLIGGGTYSSNGNVTGFNTNYARQIKTTTDTYAKYPVIIEYNPKSQSITPPLFLVD